MARHADPPRAPMVDMNTIVGRAFGATSDLPRAPMVDTATIVGRAFGATHGSPRAQNAHATPVWWTLPASSRAPMVDITATVGRALCATSDLPRAQNAHATSCFLFHGTLLRGERALLSVLRCPM
ncbi:hypothetical protein [uncultured Idiomarina sp.]|uniref:hypothetical protein n=1 Tax=uncultured Idiomarina sp. TaxID=352961 RepID=UPI0032B1584D